MKEVESSIALSEGVLSHGKMRGRLSGKGKTHHKGEDLVELLRIVETWNFHELSRIT
jgi:hypothetical protein